MIHIHNPGGRAAAGVLSLALLLGLAACGPSGAEETPPPAPSSDGSVIQTVVIPSLSPSPSPSSSSPADATQEQEDQVPPDEGQSSSEEDPTPTPSPSTAPVTATTAPYSEEALEKKLNSILSSIIKDGMSKVEQARAVFTYVNKHIRFVGTSDKSDWKKGAYEGLTMGRGDCFSYYAASRALLTALDIDNLEVRRDGGTSDHWWNLVNCGDGWYHFDACPRTFKMDGFDGFMFTDEVAALYSSLRQDIPAFYSFDPSLYPERAGGSSSEEEPGEETQPPAEETPTEDPNIQTSPEPTAPEGEPSPEPSAQPADPEGEPGAPDEPNDPLPTDETPPPEEGPAAPDEADEEAPFIPFPTETEAPSENP